MVGIMMFGLNFQNGSIKAIGFLHLSGFVSLDTLLCGIYQGSVNKDGSYMPITGEYALATWTR